MRAYFASPYASYCGTKDDAVWAAMRSMVRLRGRLRPVLHVDEVGKRKNVVWSPLLHGHFIFIERKRKWSEKVALEWCLWNLETHFDTLIISDTIPRKPGYGANGVDAETQLARKLRFRIMTETDAEAM